MSIPSRLWRPWAAIVTVIALCVGPSVSPASAAVNGVLSTTTVGSGPSAVAVATISGSTLAYVTNSLDDTVSVVDTSTDAVVDTIAVGDDPRGVAINDAGTVAYVTNFADDTVSVISTTSRQVTDTIAVGDGPWGVDFARGGSLARAFVANSLADTVSLIDTGTLADVVAPIAVGDDPRAIVSGPGGSYAYVVSYGSDDLKGINLFSNAVATTQSVGDGPTAIAWVSGSIFVVTNSLAGNVTTHNTSNRTQVGTSVIVGDDPRGIVVAAGGVRAYVTNYGDGTVTVIGVSTTGSSSVFPTPITVGTSPVGVALNPGHTRAYVANSGSSSVSEIEILPPYQSFTFSVPDHQTGTTGTFTLTNPAANSTANATAVSTGNPVVVSSSTTSVCTVSGRVVTKLMAGTCTLTATAAAVTVGAFFYPEKTAGPHSFYIREPAGPQTVTFPALENVFVGARPTLGATASGTKTFASQTPSICTVSGSTLTAVAVGTCTVKVTAAAVTTGPVLWLAGEATTSWPITQASQTITFTSPGNQISSIGTFTVIATSSASLPVVVSSSTTSVCTVSGFTVTKVSTGTCTLTATAATGTVAFVTYPAATPVAHSFSIEDATQTITFDSPGTQISAIGTFTVAATSSAGLPVVVSGSTDSVCTVSGLTVTKVAPGTCTLTANAAAGTVESMTYSAASVTRSFSIEDSPQTVTFTSPGTQLGSTGTFTVTATSSVGLPVVVSSATDSVCTVAGFTVTKVAPGTCTLTANAAAGAVESMTYSAASVTRSFSIEDSPQTVTFTSPGTQLGSTGTFTVTATSSAGLPVVVSSSTRSVCTVSGFTVTKVSAGSCLLTANAAAGMVESMTYSAAAAVTRAVLIKLSPSLSPPESVGVFQPSAPDPETSPGDPDGSGSLSPSQPTAVVGGRSVPVQVDVKNPNTLTLGVRNVSLEVTVASGQGSVLSQGGTAQLQVVRGASAGIAGSGLLPQSTVQVFMTIPGSDARTIARIPVDASGAFSGDAISQAMGLERPWPIGRQVLQMVMVDADRQQTVVELTIDILQPPPLPELDSTDGSAPTLRPGQLMATNGGEPATVTVTADADQKQATVAGDGWSMAIQSDGESGGAESSGEGAVVVTLVRGQGTTVSGDGFMPGTRADVWLFSDPTLLGTAEIDENGEFSGVVNIDGNVIAAGEHTLQLQGVGADGYVRSANLGVSVVDEAPPVFAWWWVWLVVVAAVLLFALWLFALRRRRRRAARREDR